MSETSTIRHRSAIRDWFWSVDRVTVIAVGLLICIGILLSMATSPGAADRRDLSEPFYYLYRHLVFAGAGAVSIFMVSVLSPQNARRLAMLALVCSILVMGFILFFGHTAGGAQRWIRIGAFTLQPSEFAKPGLVVTFAWLFAKTRQANIPGSVIALGVYTLVAILLLAQPDFGQTLLVTFCFGAVFFMSGMSWMWIVSFGFFSMAGLISAYSFMPHVASRIDRFLNPASGDSYQVDMAMEAIQRGGFFGRGPGEGRFKNLIPDAHTDFVFSVAAEEFGMILCIAVIALYGLIIYRAMDRAIRLADATSQLAAAGLATLLGLQAFINIAVNLQIIPPKGMTLPFISYGGSSMLAMGLTVGLLLAFTRSRPGVME